MGTTSQHPASVDAYIRHGWKLTAILPGSKRPSDYDWNSPDSALTSAAHLPPQHGIGLCHAYSGTMALDVDVESRARVELMQAGIDLQDLYDAPDAVTIESGNPGHGKLLYAMPFGIPLPSKKLVDKDATGRSYNYLDFRCATSGGLSVQDVLPPTTHPETQQPYRWGGKGHWTRLPVIPVPLLNFWQSLVDRDKQANISTGGTIDTSWDEIQGALDHISPDISRDEWVQVGMALHWAGTQTDSLDQALYIWNDWSSQSVAGKYRGMKDLMHSWRGFKPDGGVTLGTLFHLARAGGWTRPGPSAQEIFATVPVPPPVQQQGTIPLEKPRNLYMGWKLPPPDIDLDMFPDILAIRAREMSENVGLDPLVPLFASLATICGAIDARTRLELMPGFQVPPIMWFMTVGEPADKKSPGSKPVYKILRDIERDDLPRYRQARLEWQGKESKHLAEMKRFRDYMANPEAQLENDVVPTVSELEDHPEPLRIVVEDITSQKLVRHAANHPRGLLCALDEMNGWFTQVTDKRAGGDNRSTWIAAFEGDRYTVDRVGDGTIIADHFAVSIYGNVQPDVYRKFSEALDEDGFAQRILPAILRWDQTKINNPVPDCFTHKAKWEQLIRNVFAMPPVTYTLSEGAFKLFREFQAWYEQVKYEERLLQSPKGFQTAFGKVEGQTGRLALILHAITDPYNLQVSEDTMARACQIMSDYMIPSLRYLHMEVTGHYTDPLEHWVMQHIAGLSGVESEITLRDLRHSARRQIAKIPSLFQRDIAVRDAMLFLEKMRWVYVIDEDQRSGGPIKWGIHPLLAEVFKEDREELLRIKQERQDQITAPRRDGTVQRRFVAGFRRKPGSLV